MRRQGGVEPLRTQPRGPARPQQQGPGQEHDDQEDAQPVAPDMILLGAGQQAPWAHGVQPLEDEGREPSGAGAVEKGLSRVAQPVGLVEIQDEGTLGVDRLRPVGRRRLGLRRRIVVEQFFCLHHSLSARRNSAIDGGNYLYWDVYPAWIRPSQQHAEVVSPEVVGALQAAATAKDRMGPGRRAFPDRPVALLLRWDAKHPGRRRGLASGWCGWRGRPASGPRRR
jgi:hypothetical protein